VQEYLNKNWKLKLDAQFREPYFKELGRFLEKERQDFNIFPKTEQIYAAFNNTSFEDVKVVILGQDPYHGKNQAHGLSFSVNENIRIPPSLKNIYKELQSDINFKIPKTGNLTNWAKEGILLLNSTLTVREGHPGSHQNKGWEIFTDAVIKLISIEKTNCVFLLWGNYAKSKANLINNEKHLVLEAAHPSPLARGAFFGCKHFSKTNNYLTSKNITPINWKISDNTLFENEL
jgi:uracil-DNA glycosylase